MIDRATKLRIRRVFRRRKRQVEDMGIQAEENLERHFIRRLGRLGGVWRFMLSWVLLVSILIVGVLVQTRALGQYYLELQPADGGTFTEGIIGTYSNANPLYASGPVDSAVSRLVFAGLLKYDEQNQLVGDLAESWSINDDETTYTVRLREGLKWHDGQPLTAEDVVFTYATIQNPDAKSPLFSSWQGIKVAAVDERTITFTLPNSLAPFPHSLTNGIVPKHVLGGVPLEQLRSVRFNTVELVGAGPFRLRTVEVVGTTPEDREERIGLVPFTDYHFSPSTLNRFVIRTFRDETRLIRDFEEQEVQAMAGLSSVPDELIDDTSLQEHNIPLTGGVMAFFRTSHEILGDVRVRRALVRAADVPAIAGSIGHPVAALNGPLLKEHIGYNPDLVQLAHSQKEANKLLDEAGWVRDPESGLRSKDGKPLKFQVISQATGEYNHVTRLLREQWRAVGVEADVRLQPESELQNNLAFHNYDVLVYGVALGKDPDSFVYWHSSQASVNAQNRLNFSEYKSDAADAALEAGRTRLDPALRAAKYEPFLEAWRRDAPALALYRPRFLYIAREPLFGLNSETINVAADRYANVHNWRVRQERDGRQ